MEKTDLVLNLTKSLLYGIYNTSSSNLNLENEEVVEYYDGKKLHINAKESHPAVKPPPLRPALRKENPVAKASAAVFRVAVLASAAFVYNEVTKNIHLTHGDGKGAEINALLIQFHNKWKPFAEVMAGYNLGAVDTVVLLVLEGLLLSSVLPVLDKYMPAACSKRLLLLNPDPHHRANLMNDILRSLVAFLGILYAIRHIEWKSSLQMAMTWSLINPGLWLLLDGTVSGFLASVSVAFVCSARIYLGMGRSITGDSESMLTIMLFIASFFFCGVIIFGKLGRFLFGKR